MMTGFVKSERKPRRTKTNMLGFPQTVLEDSDTVSIKDRLAPELNLASWVCFKNHRRQKCYFEYI